MVKPAKQLPLEEETWDKPRIFIAVVIFILFVVGAVVAKNIYFPSPQKIAQNVKGMQTGPVSHFSLPTADDVTAKIQSIQDQITHVNVADMASSSPEIQHIMQEIQALPKVPGSIAKQTCETLCSKL